MAVKDEVFKASVVASRLQELSGELTAAIGTISEQCDRNEQQRDEVKASAALVNRMATYLSSVGQFRGQGPDQIVEWFRSQVLPPRVKEKGDGEVSDLGVIDPSGESVQPSGVAGEGSPA